MLATVLTTICILPVLTVPQGQEQPTPTRPAASDPATVTEWFTIRQLATAPEDTSPPAWGTLLRRPDEGMTLLACGTNPLDEDAIVDWLSSLNATELDTERLYLERIAGTLMAVGEAPLVADVGERIANLTRVIRRPLTLELRVWPLTAGSPAPPAILSPTAYSAFCAAHTGSNPASHAAMVHTHPGRTIEIQNTTWQRYVRTSPVEVAQKTASAYPDTEHYGTGCHANVRTEPLLNSDDFVVYLQFALGHERSPPERLNSAIPGHPELDAPQLETNFGACSGRVANGGALCASLLGSTETGGNYVVTLQVHSDVPQATLKNERMSLFPIGALTNDSLKTRPQSRRSTSFDGPEQIDRDSMFGRMEVDRLTDLLQRLLDAADPETDYSLQQAGGYLALTTPTATAKSRRGAQAVERMLMQLQDRLVRSAEVHHIATGSTKAPRQPASTNGGRIENESARDQLILYEVRLPTLLGRQAAAVRMHETNTIGDLYLEVASETKILAPSIHCLQSGIWLGASVVPMAAHSPSQGPEGAELHLELDATAIGAPRPKSVSVMPSGGAMSKERIGLTRFTHDARIRPGLALQHGGGPILQGVSSQVRTIVSTAPTR
ncbi:MAG: hypothetical protein AB8H80_21230 [Planctomycetota bacterium]